jgi:hypothetical protein
MRTVLCGTAGRAALILALGAGMVGSAVAPAASASAAARPRTHAAHRQATGRHRAIQVHIGTAVAYTKLPDGTIVRTR